MKPAQVSRPSSIGSQSGAATHVAVFSETWRALFPAQFAAVLSKQFAYATLEHKIRDALRSMKRARVPQFVRRNCGLRARPWFTHALKMTG